MRRIDNTGFGNIKVIQNEGYGYGVDAVLLASFAAGETGAKGICRDSRIADLGTDCGIVAFILSHKIEGSQILGIEKREDAAGRAAEAAVMNGLDERVRIIQSDVLELYGDGDLAAEMKGRFDAVVSNPPYFRRNAAIPSGSEDRYTARHETTADIGDFADAAAALLNRGGSFYLVHRPDRLADIFAALRGADLEPKELQPVSPAQGQAANIVLIHAVKGAGPELKVLPEIPVHTADGGYTEAILGIYERL